VIEGVASWIAGTSSVADEAPAPSLFHALLPLIFGVAASWGFAFTQDKCGRLWALFAPSVRIQPSINWAFRWRTLLGCLIAAVWARRWNGAAGEPGKRAINRSVYMKALLTRLLVLAS